jgi:hypothetical protein
MGPRACRAAECTAVGFPSHVGAAVACKRSAYTVQTCPTRLPILPCSQRMCACLCQVAARESMRVRRGAVERWARAARVGEGATARAALTRMNRLLVNDGRHAWRAHGADGGVVWAQCIHVQPALGSRRAGRESCMQLKTGCARSPHTRLKQAQACSPHWQRDAARRAEPPSILRDPQGSCTPRCRLHQPQPHPNPP